MCRMKSREVSPDASEKLANIRPTSRSGDTRRTKRRFTSRFLENLKVDDHRKYREIWDSGFTGASFGVRISRATRRKFFILRYQAADGRRKRLTLGEFPLISLAEAREKARSLVVDAERGSDPAREKREYPGLAYFCGFGRTIPQLSTLSKSQGANSSRVPANPRA